MLINLRDDTNRLVVKDMLDIDFDMFVELANNGKYYININKKYRLDEEFDNQSGAEERTKHLAYVRNNLEDELRSWGCG